MKIGDTVIVHILLRAIDKGTIVDKFLDGTVYKVYFSGQTEYVNSENLEPLNCRKGDSWQRCIVTYDHDLVIYDTYLKRNVQ